MFVWLHISVPVLAKKSLISFDTGELSVKFVSSCITQHSLLRAETREEEREEQREREISL